MPHFQKNVAELRAVASMFWPEELSQEAAKLSVVPLLLNTQDQFLSILGVDVPDIAQLFVLLEAAELPANLFLKHLMILADFGGEILQRINDNFSMIFPNGRLEYEWKNRIHSYQFQRLPVKGRLNNAKLGVSGKKLTESIKLNDLLQDVIVLLLFGGASTNLYTAELLTKCEISNYFGRPTALKEFVKQRYIWVSRITAGSRSNNLGQLAQKFAQDYLETNLSIEGVHIQANGNLPAISHTNRDTNRPTTFDIVVSKNDKYVAIEVSFQVTTNSVIERKAGQAQARYRQIEAAGYKIAYILDGAGNFQRENALDTICTYSHCTVAFSRSELDVLCEFIREYLK